MQCSICGKFSRVETHPACLATRIKQATTLDELCERLNEMRYVGEASTGERTEDYLDMSSLPVFGGEEPDDTHDVWSWDEARLIVTGTGDYEIVDRSGDA